MIQPVTPNNPVNRTAEHPLLGFLYPPRAASGSDWIWRSRIRKTIGMQRWA